MNEKPITMIVKELEDRIIKVINDSNLHVALIRPIIKDIYQQIEQEYLITEKREREEFLKKEEEKRKVDMGKTKEKLKDDGNKQGGVKGG